MDSIWRRNIKNLLKMYSLNQKKLRYELSDKIRKKYNKKQGLLESLSLKKAPFILLASIFYYQFFVIIQ